MIFRLGFLAVAQVLVHKVGRGVALLLLLIGAVANARAASVSAVEVVDAGGNYITGETLTLRVTFTAGVDVTIAGGRPTIALNPGGTATYNGAAVTNVTTLNFDYPIGSETSASLTPSGSTLITLNGATIKDNPGTTDTNLTLAIAPILSQTASGVVKINHQERATVIKVVGAGSNHITGQTLGLEATYSGAVVVTGTPTLALNSGGTATYTGGSGSSVLTFVYVVASGDSTTALKAASATPFALPGGATLVNADRAAISASLGYTASASDLPPTVGATSTSINRPETVTGLAVVQAGGAYVTNDVLDVRVSFSGPVTVTGTPTLTLDNTGVASYLSGSGSNFLLFRYTVQSGQTSGGLGYAANTLALAGGTITNTGSGGVNASLAFASGTLLSAADAQGFTITNPTPATITGVTATEANGNYIAGETIQLVVTFSGVVAVTGTPTMTLNSGSTLASYSSGSGSTTLIFTYLIAAGDSASDLDYDSTAPIALPSGATICNSGTTIPATLTCATPGTAGSISDNQTLSINSGAAATVTNVALAMSDGNYTTGQVLTAQVTFSGPVTVSGGTPSLALNAGAAAYSGGSGTNILTFTRTIAGGDAAVRVDYTSTTPITGATMRNTGTSVAVDRTCPTPGTAGSISDDQKVSVNQTARTITGVTVTQSNGNYTAGQSLTLQVVFSGAVEVVGTPTIALNSGSTLASYSSGSGSATLSFTYLIGASDAASVLEVSSTTPFALPGGASIRNSNTALAAGLTCAANALSDTQSLSINSGTAFTITGVEAVQSDGNYATGAALGIRVLFSGSVDVTGTPTMALNSGGTASYVSGTGTSTLVFSYTVAVGHSAARLDYASITPITGTISNAGTAVAATLTCATPGAVDSISDDQAISINLAAHTVSGVTVSAANGNYTAGQSLSIAVAFSGAVTVTGTPTMALNSGSTLATYASGSGSATLVFTYLIAAGDSTLALDYVSTTPIALPGGATIRNQGTARDASLTCVAPGAVGSISDNQTVSVNAVPRTITGISIAEAGGNYLSTQVLTVRVVFSGAVTVGGTPTIALNSGGTASYASGSGTTTLLFSYTIAAGHTVAALDHTSNPPIVLGGGATIRNSTAVVDVNLAFAPSGALLGSNSQPVSVNLSPRAFLGGGAIADIPAGTLTFPPVSGPLETVLAASGEVSPSATRIQSLAVTLVDHPDGSSETIGVATGTDTSVAPFTLVTIGSFNNITGTLTITTSSGTPNGSDYTTILRSLVYRHANQASATPGNRRIRFTATDTDSRSGDLSTATLTVASGLPVVMLSGIVATPDTTLTYVEGSGAVAFSASATITNPTPIWQANYSTVPYNPFDLYHMINTSSVSYYQGSVLDQVVITMTNPDATGLFPNDGTETISLTLPTEYAYSVGVPGHFLAYTGEFFNPYPMYSIQNPGPAFTVVGPLATTQTITLTGGQSGAQLAQPIFISQAGKFPIPTATVENILRSLRYTNASSNPSRYGTRRLITVTVTSNSTGPAKTSVASSCLVTIVPSNHVPVLNGPVGFSVAEADALNSSVLALNGLTISDIDGNGFTERLTLGVTNGTLHIASTTGLTVSGNDTATLVLEGALDGSTGALSNALASGNLTYRPTDLFNGTDTLALSLNDLGHSSAGTALPLTGTLAIPITVTAINQPPSVVVPGTRTVAESTDLVLTNLVLADSDVGGGLIQVTLSAVHGTLTLDQTTNLVAVFSDAEGSGVPGTLIGLAAANATMTFRGTLADVANALNTLVYRADDGFYGDHDTVTVSVNDLGGTGARNTASVVPTGVTASAAGGSQAWIATNTIDVVVRFANAAPVLQPSTVNPLTENRGISVPVNASVVLRGGTGIIPTYPQLDQPRMTMYSDPVPANTGTTVLSDSNLVAWDEETKDPRGLTYLINLGVSQGRLLRQRPGDPPAGIRIVAVPVAVDEANSFTQDDLNLGYMTYTHNGTLSGDDGFVFTVRDDNPQSRPPLFGSPPATDASQGESAPIVFNIGIDRTLPQVILSGSTPVFSEPVTVGLAVPVLIDSGVQVFNSSDTNVPRQFAPAGNSGANITATISIPSGTRVAVHPSPAIQGGDDLDELGIQDSGSVHPGVLDPMTGITPLVYGASFVSGTPIGSFTGGSNGVPLVITLASPSPLLVSTVEDVIKHLTFTNTSENPSASPRLVTIQVVNGATTSSTAVSKTVNVLPYNQTPVLTSVRRILAVPNVAVPFAITRGTSTDQTVATIVDPDGDVTYTISPQPIKGTVSTTSVAGVFTYTAAVPTSSTNGIVTDEFTIIASDNGLVSDGVTPVTKSSSPLVIEVVITDTGVFAPVIDSNPPFETVQGSLLSYTPTVVLPTVGRLGLVPQLGFTLIDPGQAMTPALGFSTSDGTITWAAGWALPDGTGLEAGVVYQRLGILVNDLANETAAYQPLMLRVVQAPTGSN